MPLHVAGLRGRYAYTQDSLDRLTFANNLDDNDLDQEFSYDTAGNMLWHKRVGTYTYPAPGASAVRPHAPLIAGDRTYTGACPQARPGGRQRQRLGRRGERLCLDGENRLAAITTPPRSFAYGPDGSRLKKITPSGTTLTLGCDIERGPDGTWTKYVTPDLVRVGAAFSWLTRDHQSSVRLVRSGTLSRLRLLSSRGRDICCGCFL